MRPACRWTKQVRMSRSKTSFGNPFFQNRRRSFVSASITDRMRTRVVSKQSRTPSFFRDMLPVRLVICSRWFVRGSQINSDYEGELVAIIGKGGRRISKETALTHVIGYSIYNEGSVRDWQTHSTQWTPGKNFVSTGAFGPWMVTADEVPDPYKLELTTRLNGQVMQNASIDLMMFRLEELISYISTFISLEPGDVIVSGTPGGVGHGRKPPLYLKDGDLVEVEITSIGRLRNPVVKEELCGRLGDEVDQAAW
jgi:2-keto-4-pentenoate hydratase/2-oxohepta-3-ene-1,7-dioic acid hydratase in catechol pathway